MIEVPEPRVPTAAEPIVVAEHAVTRDELRHWEEVARRTPEFRDAPLGTIQQAVARMFIDLLWMQSEARLRGLEVTDAEVDALVEARRQEHFPGAGAFAAYLEDSGQRVDDLRLKVRADRYSEVLRLAIRREAAGAEDEDQRIDELLASYRQRWSARTRCLDPYLVADRCGP